MQGGEYSSDGMPFLYKDNEVSFKDNLTL